MDNFLNTIRELIKTTGKIIFVIGLVFSIIMILFGRFPNFIFILFMISGAGLVYFHNKINLDRFSSLLAPLSNSLNFVMGVNKLKQIFKIVMISAIGLLVAVVGFFIFSQNHFKEQNTITRSKEIVASLNSYKAELKTYPKSLTELIGNNPIRGEWIKDCWGNEYSYIGSESSFILVSKGADGIINTADDLKYTNQ